MYRIRPWLYVGKYSETLDLRLLSANGIDAVLELAELVEQPGIACLYVRVEDGEPLPPERLREGMAFVRANVEEGNRVLIAYGAGISRSVAFAVAALRELEGKGLLDALRSVAQRHPQAMPHPAIWRSLCAYYGESIPFVDTLN